MANLKLEKGLADRLRHSWNAVPDTTQPLVADQFDLREQTQLLPFPETIRLANSPC